MPTVRWKGEVPASIAEGSGPGDWVANLALSGDLSRLVAVETTGPMAAFFSATWNAATGLATVSPAARLDFEAFSAAGVLPQVEIGLAFRFDDGSRQQDEAAPIRVSVLDRDDTPPEALSFNSGGTVAAGAIGAAIGTLSVRDPDSAGRFSFSFAPEDEWRFEVAEGGLLKLRDGISLGWDDVPVRPVIVQVSDGVQSAAFQLDIAVTEPVYDGPAPYTPPVLARGEAPRPGGFVLSGGDGGHEALTTRPSADATAVTPHAGGFHRVLLDTGESVWTGPAVDRVRFSDGRLELAADGPAAHAAALHRAILAEDADGADLAPLVASLRAGAGWAEVARDLLATAPALAALDDAAFVRALSGAAAGNPPDAAALSLHAGRLAAGAASRAQVAVDIALSPEALADLAEDAPAGHWVADPFDADSAQPVRPTFEDAPPAPAPMPTPPTGWFM